MTAILDPPTATASHAADDADDAALIAAAVDVVHLLGRGPLGGEVSDVELASSVAGLHRLETMVAAEKLRRVAEVDRRGAAAAVGARSTDDLLTGLGLTRGEARSQVGTAQALGRLPETARRFAAGELGAGQAAEAARALDQLPDTGDADRDRETAAGLDRLVAGQPTGIDRRQLRDHVDRWAHQHTTGDPLGERERRAHQRRHLWAGRSRDGDLLLEGRLTAQTYAKLGALLDPLARRSGPDDDRSIGQRRHDALATILGHAAAVTRRPEPAGSARPADRRGGGGAGDAEPAADARDAEPAAGAGGVQPGAADSGVVQPGADAAAAAVGDAGRAHVLLLTTPDALHDRPGHPPSQLDGYGPVSSATARQLCCDADITTILIGADGTPLDVGRTHRLPTRRQRLAVIARDQTCVGCGAPARRCQIHHIRWWRHHGATDLDNLCLVCPGCHTNIHHFGWTITRTNTGRYRAAPPRPPP